MCNCQDNTDVRARCWDDKDEWEKCSQKIWVLYWMMNNIREYVDDYANDINKIRIIYKLTDTEVYEYIQYNDE